MCRTSHSLPFRAAVWVRSSGSHFDMLSPNVNHTGTEKPALACGECDSIAKASSLAARATSFEPARRHDKRPSSRVKTPKDCQLLQVDVLRGSSVEWSCYIDMSRSGVLKL